MNLDPKLIAKLRDEQVDKIVNVINKKLPDPRYPKGTRYSYNSFLKAIITAMTAGMRSISAITQFISSPKGNCFFKKGKKPSYNCIRNLLMRLDHSVMLNSIYEQLHNDNPKTIAIDGKTSRRAKNTNDRTGVSILNLATHHGTIIAQIPINNKTNEIPAANKAIAKQNSNIEGCIITADAIHTQTKLARNINSHKAFYILVVKENQLKLLQECEYWINKLPAQQAITFDKEHGRIETRAIKVTDAPATISRYWAGCTKIARIDTQRIVLSKQKETNTISYIITNIPKDLATPETLLALKRGHWGIENKLHYVLDELFAEDRCRCRTKHLPFVMSALRKITLAILHKIGKGVSPTLLVRSLQLA